MDPRTKFVISLAVMIALVLIAVAIGLTRESPFEYSPEIDPANFVVGIDNQFLPLVPGTVLTYEGTSADGTEIDEVNVTADTRVVMGVTCVVVRDTVWVNGELSELTYDWYAQDKEGNVWYFGEDSKEYSGGAVVSTEGSWEAGVGGAQPGIVMMGSPVISEIYQQEYQKGVAEDMAQVTDFNTSVTVPYGSFNGCLKTKEWTPLETGVVEDKYYAPGIGVVKEQMVLGGSDVSELVSIVTLTF
jgi:hypothetical protein